MAGFYVVLTIVLFLCVDLVVMRVRAKRTVLASGAGKALTTLSFQPRAPEGVLFARSHTWIDLLSSGHARLGLDDFLAGLLVGAEITLVKNEADRVEKGEPLLVLAQNGRALAVRSPISGEVVALNRSIEGKPGLERSNSLVDLWAYTIRPGRPDEFRALLTGTETRSWMSGEMQRLRDFFSGALNSVLRPEVALDGEIPAAGAMLRLGPGEWRQFENEFLQVRERARTASQ